MTFDDRPIQSRHDSDTLPTMRDPELSTEHVDDEAEPEVRTEQRQGSLVREVIETLLLALIIFVAVRAVVLNFRVDGLSMTPSLQNNEMLLVNRNSYFSFDTWAVVDWLPFVGHDEKNEVHPFGEPERGDIVVFDAPVEGADKPYIKRIIGLPGETVEVHDNHVYIDGQQLDEPYLKGALTWCRSEGDPCPAVTVPDGKIFVMGDNRDNSQDSRYFGPVAIDAVIGKAWVTYWPTDVIGVVPHYDYPEISESS